MSLKYTDSLEFTGRNVKDSFSWLTKQQVEETNINYCKLKYLQTKSAEKLFQIAILEPKQLWKVQDGKHYGKDKENILFYNQVFKKQQPALGKTIQHHIALSLSDLICFRHYQCQKKHGCQNGEMGVLLTSAFLGIYVQQADMLLVCVKLLNLSKDELNMLRMSYPQGTANIKEILNN